MSAVVEHVHRSAEHTFSKAEVDEIVVVAGLGVEGDAHQGPRVKHRSRVEANPDQPNLRQVSFIQAEVLDEAVAAGFEVGHGALGENITTRGIDLLTLPVGTTLRIGEAILALTGLRNPCKQINGFQDGLMAAMIGRNDDGALVRKAGVMSVVVLGGTIRRGDEIDIGLPAGEPIPMELI